MDDYYKLSNYSPNFLGKLSLEEQLSLDWRLMVLGKGEIPIDMDLGFVSS